jgi:hypothetical protein
MGYGNRQAALLNMPTGFMSVMANLIVGFGIRRTSNRWMWAVGLTVRKFDLYTEIDTVANCLSWYCRSRPISILT